MIQKFAETIIEAKGISISLIEENCFIHVKELKSMSSIQDFFNWLKEYHCTLTSEHIICDNGFGSGFGSSCSSTNSSHFQIIIKVEDEVAPNIQVKRKNR